MMDYNTIYDKIENLLEDMTEMADLTGEYKDEVLGVVNKWDDLFSDTVACYTGDVSALFFILENVSQMKEELRDEIVSQLG